MDSNLVDIAQFHDLDIRVGTVLSARNHPTARKPSIILEIDFGPLGVKQSSAQIRKRYQAEELTGSQVIALTNLPPLKVADVVSQCLVLGILGEEGDVTLLRPDSPTPPGAKIA